MSNSAELCDTRHLRVDEILDEHTKELHNHNDRLDKLENNSVRTDTMMANLCKRIDLLISVLLWCFGLSATTLIGFFIWYLQKLD